MNNESELAAFSAWVKTQDSGVSLFDAYLHGKARGASANETGAEVAAELESMTRMFHAACYDLGLINEALGLDPDDGGAEPILDAIAELRAQIASAQTDEPVAWAVYNGWSRICFYMTEEDARDHAQKAQKNHDLSGSLAAFRVVPLYAAPQPARAATPDAEAVNWRELSRRLYVELFHCDQQMRSTRDEDGEPHWTQSAVVRDVLADAKAALDGAPQPAQADARVGLTDEQRVTIQHAADKLRTVWANHTGDKESRELCHKLESIIAGANHAK
ncbi:hypothetical protein KTE58_11625 [Burkholderia multivorans]|uniref:hypothetical protein n=2 Tax=Burkholderia multivorans TaxID=87883 RepID=UPI001C25CB91|nr:hypothetical protein [Burkholderia multivorans]MBU9537042.1 hypothetical protein [Burkholderia multivorans]HEF4774343.1 hypothetical protein [Burkholderia multivorans]